MSNGSLIYIFGTIYENQDCVSFLVVGKLILYC